MAQGAGGGAGGWSVDEAGGPQGGGVVDLPGYAGSERLPPGASTLQVRLNAEGTGTRVNLEHRDLPRDEQPGHATGWIHYLARLAVAPVGDAGHDPGMPAPDTTRI